MYQGTLTILGDPNIRPWDIVHIHDDTTEMYGPIEVEQVVTTISPTTGYTTTIIPNALIYHNNIGVTLDRNLLLLTTQMRTLLTVWTALKWSLIGIGTTIGWRTLRVLGTNKITKVDNAINSLHGIFNKSAKTFLQKPRSGKGKVTKDFLETLSKKERKLIKQNLTSAELAEFEKLMSDGYTDLRMPKEVADAVQTKKVTKGPAGKNQWIKTTTVYKNQTWRKKLFSTVGSWLDGMDIPEGSALSKNKHVVALRSDLTSLNELNTTIDEINKKLKNKDVGYRTDRQIRNAKERLRSLRRRANALAPTIKDNVKELDNSGRSTARRSHGQKRLGYRKLVEKELMQGTRYARFGLKALNLAFYGLALYEIGSFLWDNYQLQAKTSILQANLLAGSNQLTVVPLEHPAGKDYVAGLEGVIGTASGSSQILFGFASGASNNRSIRVQDIALQNMLAAID
jgi:hypothetical protein